ncbi:MAG: signal peptide peptidase SppA [Myxococcota bacterium]|nr:signal peptide peptidase SppA [Myxococcota bacterium]
MTRTTLVRIGVFSAGVLVLLFLFRGDSPLEIEPGSTVVIEIGGGYVEGPAAPLLANLLGGGQRPFVGLLSTLAMLERDDRVATVVLHIRELGIGWAKAQEIRTAVGRLRDAGRKTVVFLEMASFSPNLEYFVASAADEIHVPPGAALPMLGLAAEYLYFGGLLEKLGIEVAVTKVGRFKSGAESIAEKQMSEAARLQANALLDSTFEYFVAGIAQGRGLSVDAVTRTIDAGPVRAGDLVDADFIDGITRLEDLTDGLAAPVVPHDEYLGVTAEDVGFEPVAEFALVYGTGNVVSGSGTTSRSGEPLFASETVGRALREAAEDPRFGAIILRIDSPGGSALASEMIWQALQAAREHGKPIVASFSDVAASGGYYVGAGADAIVASPLSLTGSIGVFALRPILGDLLDEVGIGVESITRGRNADFYLSSEPPSPGAQARMQSMVEEIYELFVERVAAGRGISTEAVDEVAQGRVWTAAQAHELGLVDALGGLRAAVSVARQRASLEADADVALVPYPGAPALATQIRELMGVHVNRLFGQLPWTQSLDASAPSSRLLDKVRSFSNALPLDQPLALAPLLPDIR